MMLLGLKVEIQGRIQISLIIQFHYNKHPKDTTEEIVAKVYETGWRSGHKVATVYRDSSRVGFWW